MLVVAFGGSEGGQSFADEHTRDLRSKFAQLGFSFLSVGYFGDDGLPKKLDRISLTAIYDTIQQVGKKLKISTPLILLIGASRGAELALNLASRYEFMGVIALVPSGLSIPYVNNKENASSWTFNYKEVPALNLTYDQIKKVGWFKAIETGLKNSVNKESAAIKVENIEGFIFLSSAKNDELWPSEQMCADMIERLKRNNFKYHYEHVSMDGGHQPSKHWDVALGFMEKRIQEVPK